MSAYRMRAVRAFCITLVSITLVLVQIANAQTNVAAGVDATAKVTYNNCVAANKGNAAPCQALPCAWSADGTVSGVATPIGCKATSASGLSGGNSLSSLSQLSGILGQLLGKLLQPSSGSGSSPTTVPASTGCTTGYIYTSDPTQIGVNPCALYQPSAASQLTTGTTGTTGDTSAQDLLNALTGGNSNSTGTTGGSLSVVPQTGPAPLSVTLTSNSIVSGSYSIDFGDGSVFGSPSSEGCTSTTPSTCQYQISHTYESAGTYTAVLSDQNGATIGTAQVAVVNPGGTSATSTGISSVLSNIGNFLTGPTSAQGPTQTSPSFPGVFGNILLDQNGATIFASTINAANNSETSGFYGTDTVGGTAQSGAGQLCLGRPWASNFLANIIPPSFFDSLCEWGGYQVGQPAPAQVQAQPQVTLQQQPAKPVQQPTTTVATSTAPAQVEIWAVPAAVQLGARTSIFWTTQNANNCIESSPDGNFTQNSLSGAASTVPLTGATTFTISCLDGTGNPVTNYVTVQISS